MNRLAVLVVLLSLIAWAQLPQATAEFEFRRQVRAGDMLFNSEITIFPVLRLINHQETLAETDTEAFALSPLSPAGGGITIARTSSDTVVATQTGLFAVTLPIIWLPEYPARMIGDRPDWAATTYPIRFAGLPLDTMMIFPAMDLVTRPETGRDDVANYTIDARNRVPFDQGNVMLIKNTTDEKGNTITTLERQPRPYMTLIATRAEVANKTILERMWRNVRLNYNLDRAYVGPTSFPLLVYPVRDTASLMTMVPDQVSISAALNMTRPGMHMRRIFWPVAV